mmetsp:Transcript_13631/g.21283  ORF Transcript_13631/g.21283 Transcript_13631/m.21283 type:complete len:206 (+) Transcript_13631:90-707(+)
MVVQFVCLCLCVLNRKTTILLLAVVCPLIPVELEGAHSVPGILPGARLGLVRVGLRDDTSAPEGVVQCVAKALAREHVGNALPERSASVLVHLEGDPSAERVVLVLAELALMDNVFDLGDLEHSEEALMLALDVAPSAHADLLGVVGILLPHPAALPLRANVLNNLAPVLLSGTSSLMHLWSLLDMCAPGGRDLLGGLGPLVRSC